MPVLGGSCYVSSSFVVTHVLEDIITLDRCPYLGRMLRCAIVRSRDPCSRVMVGVCFPTLSHLPWPPCLGAYYWVLFSCAYMRFSNMRKYDILCASGSVLRYFGACFVIKHDR